MELSTIMADFPLELQMLSGVQFSDRLGGLYSKDRMMTHILFYKGEEIARLTHDFGTGERNVSFVDALLNMTDDTSKQIFFMELTHLVKAGEIIDEVAEDLADRNFHGATEPFSCRFKFASGAFRELQKHPQWQGLDKGGFVATFDGDEIRFVYDSSVAA